MDVPAIVPTSTLRLILSPIAPPESLVSMLPYDILLEIFTHCLPRYPLHQRQPSTKTAPILLCHICSSWRRLALASATLWAHLSYGFTVKTYSIPGDSASWTVEFKEGDIEFIQWWRANHGQVARFLSFSMDKLDRVPQKPVKTNSVFLLDYITSAQHLKLDRSFWHWLLSRQNAGHQLVFPTLHTALAAHTLMWQNPLYTLQTLPPVQPLPALRRLSLRLIRFPRNDFAPPAHWTALTHMSLYCSLSLSRWQTLIRALPHLFWGHFNILLGRSPFDIIPGTAPPLRCTLPNLISLSIVHSTARGVVFPLSALFATLHLPALHTLALSSPSANIWEDTYALDELCAVLASTPAMNKLVLKEQHIVHWDEPDDTTTLYPTIHNTHTAIHRTPPIWHHVPHLAHIQLVHPAGLTAKKAEWEQVLIHFVHDIFSDSSWFDLRNAACPIRTVTIDSGEAFGWSEWGVERARECAAEVPAVKLEVTKEWTGLVVADVKEWGARV